MVVFGQLRERCGNLAFLTDAHVDARVLRLVMNVARRIPDVIPKEARDEWRTADLVQNVVVDEPCRCVMLWSVQARVDSAPDSNGRHSTDSDGHARTILEGLPFNYGGGRMVPDI